jgi:flavin-dependent dehydrogenase
MSLVTRTPNPHYGSCGGSVMSVRNGAEIAAGDQEAVLAQGSRVAIIGGGPAGSLFAHFVLTMAARVDLDIAVDIYEPRDFDHPGPIGCNMCGGLLSETLVQNLAADGVLPDRSVIQRGLDSYVLHTDVGSVRIAAPHDEVRMGAVHRGSGPRDALPGRWASLDQYLLTNAMERGAKVIRTRVDEVTRRNGRPAIRARGGDAVIYDLAVVATGVNTSLLKTFEGLDIGYERPRVTKTLIREYNLGRDVVDRSLGTSMHVFLLSIRRLEFAALIPKGDYVTMCLLGDELDTGVADAFAASPEVRRVMPAGWDPTMPACQCLPRMNVRGVDRPYADRVVFIGDSGVTRLYKDGIGSAYRTAKAAATTAVFHGISEPAFHDHFLPICRSISGDNRIGRVAFLLTRVAQRLRPLRRAILRIARDEQRGGESRMSSVLWDMFSGSAPYSEILRRMVDPRLIMDWLRVLPGALFGRAAPPGQ